MLSRQLQDAREFPSSEGAHYLEKTLFCWLEVKEGASSHGEEATSMPGEDCRLFFMLPARISQSFRGIDDVVFEWIDSSLQFLFSSCMPSSR